MANLGAQKGGAQIEFLQRGQRGQSIIGTLDNHHLPGWSRPALFCCPASGSGECR